MDGHPSSSFVTERDTPETLLLPIALKIENRSCRSARHLWLNEGRGRPLPYAAWGARRRGGFG